MTDPTPTKEEQVYQLVQELEEVKLSKKASVRGFNDEIKRINAEIKEILNAEKV